MKLNNKGFAVSIILYTIASIVVVVLLLVLSIYATDIGNSNDLTNEIKKEVSGLD